MMPRLLPSLLLLAGCPQQFECSADLPCASISETCQAGTCVVKRCANSGQCPMESYCSQGECLPGCVDPSDCYPGATCDIDTKTCADVACEDTQIDCGYRQFCNKATGDCYDAGDQYCKFCDYQPGECGGTNLCYAHYCGVDCSQGQPCPSGFECTPFTDDAGNITTYQCFTYCWLYEDYQPGGPVKGGLKPLGPLYPPQSSILESE